MDSKTLSTMKRPSDGNAVYLHGGARSIRID